MIKIPPFKLKAEPMNETARQLKPFKWAAPDVGHRHRLGGVPKRPVAAEDWPTCPDCGDSMTFYGQLDSINDEICIADAGLIYVYICLKCNEVKAVIDSS